MDKLSNILNYQTIADCKFGKDVKLMQPYNIYGCEFGDGCFVGPFVEIQKNVKIGTKTRISSHTFICEYVTIGDNCFIGHGVVFTNDKFTDENSTLYPTKIGNNVKIGSNSTILPVSIGDNTIIGAGTVVTKDIPPNSIAYGNPIKIKSI
jgi:acetyltransferase-like isoleucine patch superfamily enzyme